MKRLIKDINVLLVLLLISTLPVFAGNVTTTWGGDAEMVYDTGFMHMLMKHQDGGVSLFNMELVENDAPGSGQSGNVDVDCDFIWGKNHAKKILNVEDPRAHKAFVVLYFRNPQEKHPLQFKVNGHPRQFIDWNQKKSNITLRWTEFPVEWLRKGKNVIELF